MAYASQVPPPLSFAPHQQAAPALGSQTAALFSGFVLSAVWAGVSYWRSQGMTLGQEPAAASPIIAASTAVFLLALLAFFRGATSATRFYPLVVLGILQHAAQSVYFLGFAILTMTQGLFLQFHLGLLITHAVFGAVAAAVMLAAGVASLILHQHRDHGEGALANTGGPVRNHIRAYFTSKPFWPWLMIPGAIAALMQALNQGGFYFSGWVILLEVLFLLALWRLLSDDRRTVRVLDAPVFFVALHTVDLIQDLIVSTFVSPGYDMGADVTEPFWPTYINRYYIVLCAVAVLYALAYRFLIYPSFRRATDKDIDALVEQDMQPLLQHGLIKLGVERAQLIAEPVLLRGLPDRETLGGAFIGAHIGKDDVLRFTPQRGTVMAFGDDQVHFYEGTVDVTTGNIIHESVVEFFYQDISNVARVNGTQTVPLASAITPKDRFYSMFSRRKARRHERVRALTSGESVQCEGQDVFQINLESGRALSVILKDAQFFDKSKRRFVGMLDSLRPSMARSLNEASTVLKTDLPVQHNERVMRAIRLLIRDKKRSLLHERT